MNIKIGKMFMNKKNDLFLNNLKDARCYIYKKVNNLYVVVCISQA